MIIEREDWNLAIDTDSGMIRRLTKTVPHSKTVWWRGCKANQHGHLHVNVNGKNQRVHRLIMEAVCGEIPYGYEVDHINNNPADNRLRNLRLVTRSENQRKRYREDAFNKEI